MMKITVTLEIKRIGAFAIWYAYFALILLKEKESIWKFYTFHVWHSTKRWVSMKRDGFKTLCGCNLEKETFSYVMSAFENWQVLIFPFFFASAFPYSGCIAVTVFLPLFPCLTKNYMCMRCFAVNVHIFQFNACSQNISFHSILNLTPSRMGYFLRQKFHRFLHDFLVGLPPNRR